MPQFTIQLSDEQIAQLKKEARRDVSDEIDEDSGEFFNPYDMYGGNFDDAYQGGRDDSDTDNARFLLTLIGETW